MDDSEKRELMNALIDDIQVYPEPKANGQWLKSVGFKLPLIDGSLEMNLDGTNGLETVMLFTRRGKGSAKQ